MFLTRAAVFFFCTTFCVIQARYTGNKIKDILVDLMDNKLNSIDKKELFHQKRIINGEDVKSSWPWLVVLKIFDPNTGEISHNFCGSSLLNSRWLLTAAHCFSGETNEEIDAKLDTFAARLGDKDVQVTAEEQLKNDIANFLSGIGNLDLEQQEMNELLDWMNWEVGFEKVIVHPEYAHDATLNHPNDIALVKLAEDVPATPDVVSRISAVNLPDPSDGTSWPPVGANCTLKGWGCTEAYGSVVKELRKTNYTVRDGQKCQELEAITATFETRLCAGNMPTEEDVEDMMLVVIQKHPELLDQLTGNPEMADILEKIEQEVVWDTPGGSSACQGDSGGPLMCEKDGEWVQAGVVSYGIMDSTDMAIRFPTIFTRVSHYIDWIEQTIAEN